ncbi:unnamed protein product, partial [Mesorhabditis spiculigera]
MLLESWLALATIFILLALVLFMLLVVYFLLKYYYDAVAQQGHPVPRGVQSHPTINADNEPTGADVKNVFHVTQPPRILYENEEELPDYPDYGSRSASPLPSYDDVVYCDQVNRSFQNLLNVV